MNQPIVERRGGRPPDGIDRRQRKQDPWRKVLNVLAYVVYPLLMLNFFIFIAISTEDQKANIASKMGETAERIEAAGAQIPQADAEHATAAKRGGGWQINTFLPIMAVGVVIGAAGIVIDRKRARRRSDSSLMTPLILTVMSVLGMLIYFVVRGVMY
jgi:hypothetical protein